MIEYFPADDIKNRVDEIIDLLMFDHVRAGNVYCVRSRGSQSRRTIARIHGLGRIWQLAMKIDATYIIEVISEQFDSLSKEGQDRVLVHELLHIPHGFQGGFRHHKDYVTSENVDVWFKRLQEKRKELGRLRKD
ncbi:MAG: putative metallopeptidase [Candidatus Bathyarchaeota archaeon]|nr:putative metallopeptidase [Candidatus Bathyarchaeota archaeon]